MISALKKKNTSKVKTVQHHLHLQLRSLTRALGQKMYYLDARKKLIDTFKSKWDLELSSDNQHKT